MDMSVSAPSRSGCRGATPKRRGRTDTFRKGIRGVAAQGPGTGGRGCRLFFLFPTIGGGADEQGSGLRTARPLR
eukprot:7099632-Pyramimonas_sp.AAC.1